MQESGGAGSITIFLSGDVMTGRGIDQILPYPSQPELHESFMTSSLGYVELADRLTGPVPRRVAFPYVWGDALRVLDEVGPDFRIINLETSVTTSEDWERKGINYRMHPKNVGVLRAAKIDACALANNHVLDWGVAGLLETLATLRNAGVKTAGAGRDSAEAGAPAVLDIVMNSNRNKVEDGRVLLFSLGSVTSGVPREWAASSDRPGVCLLADFSEASLCQITRQVSKAKRPGDVVVVSLHWGENWGYEIPSERRRFAHALIDEAQVDLIHGHSSHHVKGVEVYRGKLILHGCGDFLNDYEGIAGYEEFRAELALMYFPEVEVGTGRLLSLRMAPMRIRHFRLQRATGEEARWLQRLLSREGKRLGTEARLDSDRFLLIEWASSSRSSAAGKG